MSSLTYKNKLTSVEIRVEGTERNDSHFAIDTERTNIRNVLTFVWASFCIRNEREIWLLSPNWYVRSTSLKIDETSENKGRRGDLLVDVSSLWRKDDVLRDESPRIALLFIIRRVPDRSTARNFELFTENLTTIVRVCVCVSSSQKRSRITDKVVIWQFICN